MVLFLHLTMLSICRFCKGKGYCIWEELAGTQLTLGSRILVSFFSRRCPNKKTIRLFNLSLSLSLSCIFHFGLVFHSSCGTGAYCIRVLDQTVRKLTGFFCFVFFFSLSICIFGRVINSANWK